MRNQAGEFESLPEEGGSRREGWSDAAATTTRRPAGIVPPPPSLKLDDLQKKTPLPGDDSSVANPFDAVSMLVERLCTSSRGAMLMRLKHRMTLLDEDERKQFFAEKEREALSTASSEQQQQRRRRHHHKKEEEEASSVDETVPRVRGLDLSSVDLSGRSLELPRHPRQYLESLEHEQRHLTHYMRPTSKRVMDDVDPAVKATLFRAKPALRYDVELQSSPAAHYHTLHQQHQHHQHHHHHHHHHHNHHGGSIASTSRSIDSFKSGSHTGDPSSSAGRAGKKAASVNLKMCSQLLAHRLVRETATSLLFKRCSLDALSVTRLRRDGLSKCSNNLTRLDLSDNPELRSGECAG